MKLSENFSLKEFTKSSTATRLGIDNTPEDEHLEAAVSLFTEVVQPVRDNFGSTTINSGYRGPDLNEAVGGSSRSQHCKGQAADIECRDASNMEVATWIKENLEIDQLILEFYSPTDPDAGWVHVSYRNDGENRGSILTASKVDGKTVYSEGLG